MGQKLTNAINNDGILTRQALNERKALARTPADPPADDGKTAASTASRTDIDRAQQRLTNEVDRGEATTPGTPAQAFALAEAIGRQLLADPQAAMRAMGQISDTLYEAATARPTA